MDLPNYADFVLSPAQNLQLGPNHSQLFMFYGLFVHVGETLNRFADFGR